MTITATPSRLASMTIDAAVDSGILADWAEVISYDRGRCVVLARTDTDGMPLEVRINRVRQAYRRYRQRGPEALGIDASTAASIERVLAGGGIEPLAADAIVQIAAIGRVIYHVPFGATA